MTPPATKYELKDQLVNSFVDHFWRTPDVDAALKEYAEQSIHRAIDDGDDADTLAASLVDFLPTLMQPDALKQALGQLFQAVQDPTIDSSTFTWTQKQTQQGGVSSSADNDAKSSSRLSITAAAWEPPAPLTATNPSAELAQAMQVHTLDDADGYGFNDHDGVYYNERGLMYNDGSYQHDLGADDQGGWQHNHKQGTAPQSTDDHVTYLAQQFPEYSVSALAGILKDCGGDLMGAMDTLLSMENELFGQLSKEMEVKTVPPRQIEAEFSPDDFPSLGGPAPVTVITPAFGTNYAVKAKQAAALPAPVVEKKQKPPGASSSSSGGGAAPVWLQSEGIRRFETGASVAQDYAEMRSVASDHARARNACFQQATAAYLAGNRALAKDLGIKGRWHNEQMKAAHQQAAQETFSKRNAHLAKVDTSSEGATIIDLHGLHVSEALKQLKAMIESMQSRGGGRLQVVVGVGQHGKVPAGLPPAVKRFVQKNGLAFREVYDGLIEVRVR